MKKEILTIGITVLLLTIVLMGCFENKEDTSTTGSKIIYVDDDGGKDYTRIQDAINVASEGDTIFVHDGTYNEILIINKSINLIGLNKNNTIIRYQKSNEINQKNVVLINADNCTIREFEIIGDSTSSDIIGININSLNNIISNNILMYTYQGIYIGVDSKNNNVSGNAILDNTYGIYTDRSFNNNISKNNISMSIFAGIHLHVSNNNIVFGNTISNNKFDGIRIKGSEYNTVFGNLLIMNPVGVHCCCGAKNNVIYSNNFKENSDLNAQDDEVNQWDNGINGNYWDDYMGVDSDGDGIGDTPYNLSREVNQDRYPLMDPVDT